MFKKYFLIPLIAAVTVFLLVGSLLFSLFASTNDFDDQWFKKEIEEQTQEIKNLETELSYLKDDLSPGAKEKFEHLNYELEARENEIDKMETHQKEERLLHQQRVAQKRQNLIIIISIIVLVIFTIVFTINFLIKANKIRREHWQKVKESYLFVLSILFLIVTLLTTLNGKTTSSIVFAILFGGSTIAYVLDKHLKNKK